MRSWIMFIILLAFSPVFSIEEFRIDFGNYVPDPTGNWNTVYDSAPNDSLVLIDYNTGSMTNVKYSGTNWDFDTSNGWNSGNTDWIDSDAANDALYADTDASFTISGLSDNKYRIELVSSRNIAYISDITIGGLFSDSTGLGEGNSDDWNTRTDGYESGNWMIWTDVIPVDGSITVDYGINSSSFIINNCVLIRGIADPPSVSADAATGISSYSAVFNGTVNANGDNTDVTFEYGTDLNYGSTVTADQSPVTGTTATAVSSPVIGLEPNTMYYYRVSATNAGGTVKSISVPFTTSPESPVNIAISNDGSEVTVSWDAVAGASSYKIYSSVDPYTGFQEVSTGSYNGTSWTGPFDGNKLFYFVVAVN